jgi:amino acid transporter
MIWIAGERRIFRVVVASILITAMLYVLFAVVFGMNVPEASLF